MFTSLQLESIVLCWKQKQTSVTPNPYNYLGLVQVSNEALHDEAASSEVIGQWNKWFTSWRLVVAAVVQQKITLMSDQWDAVPFRSFVTIPHWQMPTCDTSVRQAFLTNWWCALRKTTWPASHGLVATASKRGQLGKKGDLYLLIWIRWPGYVTVFTPPYGPSGAYILKTTITRTNSVGHCALVLVFLCSLNVVLCIPNFLR